MLIISTCAVPSPYPLRHFFGISGCRYGEGRVKVLERRVIGWGSGFKWQSGRVVKWKSRGIGAKFFSVGAQ